MFDIWSFQKLDQKSKECEFGIIADSNKTYNLATTFLDLGEMKLWIDKIEAN